MPHESLTTTSTARSYPSQRLIFPSATVHIPPFEEKQPEKMTRVGFRGASCSIRRIEQRSGHCSMIGCIEINRVEAGSWSKDIKDLIMKFEAGIKKRSSQIARTLIPHAKLVVLRQNTPSVSSKKGRDDRIDTALIPLLARGKRLTNGRYSPPSSAQPPRES